MKMSMKRISRTRRTASPTRLGGWCSTLLVLTVAIASSAAGQKTLKGRIGVVWGDPCCGIVAIEGDRGIVTAVETATQRTVQFRATPAVLKTLTIGKKVWLDLAGRKVSLNGTEPCCAMVGGVTGPLPSAPPNEIRVATHEPTNGVRVAAAEPTNGIRVTTNEPVNGIRGSGSLPPNEIRGSAKGADPCCGITGIDGRTGVASARDLVSGRSFQFVVTNKALLGTLTIGRTLWADFVAGRVRINSGEPCCAIITGSVR